MPDIASVIDEIIDLSMPQLPPAGAFTVDEYHARLDQRGIHVTRYSATRQLQKQVSEGELQSRLAWVDQRHQRVYWKVGGPD